MGCADGVGDGQHLLPIVEFGEEDIAAGAIGAILGHLEQLLTGPLRNWGKRGVQSFRIVSNRFGVRLWRRLNKCAVDDGGA